MFPQDKEIVPDEPELGVLNFFCFVVINGSWHRFTLFTYLAFDFFAYYLNVHDFPPLEKIIAPFLDGYMDFQRWMPLQIYHSTTLFCQGWDTITTMGFKGLSTAEKTDGYPTLDVILFGFTGLWIQNDHSDFALGFAKCVVTV